MKVNVVPYDPNWPAEFMAEASTIRSALGETAVAVHHIGSTSIPGIFAKPVIDILLEVEDILRLEADSTRLADLGYQAMGEFGIPGRRYFRKESPIGVRTHHVHAFTAGSPALERHLAFRDYMIAHPAIAQSYSSLKQRLAAAHPDDIESYMDGKDSFIKEHERKAMIWRKEKQEGRWRVNTQQETRSPKTKGRNKSERREPNSKTQ
jgi:GrpB-like predicted nucleotidyltransferase (UPF0157 family)